MCTNHKERGSWRDWSTSCEQEIAEGRLVRELESAGLPVILNNGEKDGLENATAGGREVLSLSLAKHDRGLNYGGSSRDGKLI